MKGHTLRALHLICALSALSSVADGLPGRQTQRRSSQNHKKSSAPPAAQQSPPVLRFPAYQSYPFYPPLPYPAPFAWGGRGPPPFFPRPHPGAFFQHNRGTRPPITSKSSDDDDESQRQQTNVTSSSEPATATTETASTEEATAKTPIHRRNDAKAVFPSPAPVFFATVAPNLVPRPRNSNAQERITAYTPYPQQQLQPPRPKSSNKSKKNKNESKSTTTAAPAKNRFPANHFQAQAYARAAAIAAGLNPNFIRRPPSISPFLNPANAKFYLNGNPFAYLRPPPYPPRFVQTTTTTSTTTTPLPLSDEVDNDFEPETTIIQTTTTSAPPTTTTTATSTTRARTTTTYPSYDRFESVVRDENQRYPIVYEQSQESPWVVYATATRAPAYADFPPQTPSHSSVKSGEEIEYYYEDNEREKEDEPWVPMEEPWKEEVRFQPSQQTVYNLRGKPASSSSHKTHALNDDGRHRTFNMSASIEFGKDFTRGQVVNDDRRPHQPFPTSFDQDLSAEGSSISSPAAAPSSLTPTNIKLPLQFGNRDIHVDPNARIEQIFSLNRTPNLSPFAQFVGNKKNKSRQRPRPVVKFGSSPQLVGAEMNDIEDFTLGDDGNLRTIFLPTPSSKKKNYRVGTELTGSRDDYTTSDSGEEDAADDDSAIPDEKVPGRFWDRRPWRPMPPFLKPIDVDDDGVTSSEIVRNPFYGAPDDPRLTSNLGSSDSNEIDRAIHKYRKDGSGSKWGELPTPRPSLQTTLFRDVISQLRLSTTTEQTSAKGRSTYSHSTSPATKTPATWISSDAHETQQRTTDDRDALPDLEPHVVTAVLMKDDGDGDGGVNVERKDGDDGRIRKTTASGETNDLESQGAVESQRSTQYFFVNPLRIHAKEATSSSDRGGEDGGRVRLQPSPPARDRGGSKSGSTKSKTSPSSSSTSTQRSIVLYLPTVANVTATQSMAEFLKVFQESIRRNQSQSVFTGEHFRALSTSSPLPPPPSATTTTTTTEKGGRQRNTKKGGSGGGRKDEAAGKDVENNRWQNVKIIGLFAPPTSTPSSSSSGTKAKSEKDQRGIQQSARGSAKSKDSRNGVKEAAEKPPKTDADSTPRYYDLRGHELPQAEVVRAGDDEDDDDDDDVGGGSRDGNGDGGGALEYWRRIVHKDGDKKKVYYASIPVIKRKGDTVSWELLEVPLYWHRGRVHEQGGGNDLTVHVGGEGPSSAEADSSSSSTETNGTRPAVVPVAAGRVNATSGSKAIFVSKEIASREQGGSSAEKKQQAIFIATTPATPPTRRPSPSPTPGQMRFPSTAKSSTRATPTRVAITPRTSSSDEETSDEPQDPAPTKVPNIVDLFPEYDWMASPGDPPESKMMMSIPSSIPIENLKLDSSSKEEDDDDFLRAVNGKTKPKATWVQHDLSDDRKVGTGGRGSAGGKMAARHPQRAFTLINRRPTPPTPRNLVADSGNELSPQQGSTAGRKEDPYGIVVSGDDVAEDIDDGGGGKLMYMPDPLRPLSSEAVRRALEFPDTIPGIPGVHYPTHKKVPKTNFSCGNQQWPGYYADTQADCQVWHLCAPNKSAAFLCPAGTLFNQAAMICDLWDNVPHCDLAPQLYYLNSLFVDIFLDATAIAARAASNSTATSAKPGTTTRQ